MRRAGRVLHLTEHATTWVAHLTHPELTGLRDTRAVTATPAAGGGWHLRTTQMVGAVRVGDIELRVQPKVAVERLLFLLGFVADPSGWRDDPIDLDASADHVDAIAYAFAALAHRALARGVLQGYVHREEALPVLKGRLRSSDQLTRRLGMALPVEVAFDDFTPDIVENRVLASAAATLLRVGRLRSLQPRLRHVLHTLEGVSPWPRGVEVPDVLWTRLNHRYRPAVRLARLILQGNAYVAEQGATHATGFLFDMNRVFEDFIGAALSSRLERIDGRVRLQDVSSLDPTRKISIRPDITWWRGGRCWSVIDAKYKTIAPAGPDNADLYQMLAYCIAYDVPRGHLVYADGVATERQVRYEVRNSTVSIDTHVIRLNQPPEELLRVVDRLAGRLADGVPAPEGT